MARGRFVSRSLWGSKRFAKLVKDHGAEAGLVYVACVTGADVEGRLEADGESIVDLMQRTGRALGLDAERLDRIIAASGAAGLLTVWGDAPDLFAQVGGFFDHNKTRSDREKPSAIPAPPYDNSGSPPGVLRESSGSPPADSAGVRGSTPSQVQVQVQGQVQGQVQDQDEAAAAAVPRARARIGDAAAATVAPSARTEDRPGDANQLLRIWRKIWRELNEADTAAGRKPTPMPRMAPYLADTLASQIEALRYFRDDAILEKELRRVLNVYDQRDWHFPSSAEKIVEKVGQTFEEVAAELQEPVIWQKPDPGERGRVTDPQVLKLMAGIGKAVPDG